MLWLHGYNHPTLAAAILIGRARGRRVLVRDDQTLLEPRSTLKLAARRLLVRSLFHGVTGLYVGEESRRFLRYHGLPDDRLFRVPYAVDDGLFRSRDLSASERTLLRRAFGVTDDAPVILFSGKLTGEKGESDLIDAFHHVRARHDAWLLFAGEGKARGFLESRVSALGLSNVEFLGFLNQTELADVYRCADVFTLPSSHDTWGLVVNEAMANGLPVVVSDHVGCAPDLVKEGWNGFVTPVGHVDALAASLTVLVGDPAKRRAFGENSRRHIASFSVAESANSLISAAHGLGPVT